VYVCVIFKNKAACVDNPIWFLLPLIYIKRGAWQMQTIVKSVCTVVVATATAASAVTMAVNVALIFL